MQIDIIWNETTTQVDLVDGVVTVGGNPKDGIFIEGLPHGLLSLTLDGPSVSVTAQRSVRIGQALFPARIPRLLVEGEELKLPNDVVLRRTPNLKRRESRKTMGTAFVARELLNDGALELQDTRAATLTCVTGLDRGAVFPIPFDDNTIGRGDDAPVRVRDRAVSRQHARLFRTSRTWFIEPITTSMNGVYVNGLLLRKGKALRTGDTIELGHTVLRFDEPERAPEECTKLDRKAAPPLPLPVAAETSAKLEAPVEVTMPLAVTPPQPTFSLELLLMSAGAALAVLGMSAVALVFR